MKDYPYERYLRDARILLIFEVIVLYRVLSTGLPHYNSPHYNTVFDITRPCLGSQMFIFLLL